MSIVNAAFYHYNILHLFIIITINDNNTLNICSFNYL
jgi:hypothetical protein